jgi:hypothetical protein
MATLIGADSETALRWLKLVVSILLDPAAVLLLLLAATSAPRFVEMLQTVGTDQALKVVQLDEA